MAVTQGASTACSQGHCGTSVSSCVTSRPRKSSGYSLKRSKTSRVVSLRTCACSGVSKRGIHLVETLTCPRCSWRMFLWIRRASSFLCDVSDRPRLPFMTRFSTASTFSSVTAVDGRPLRGLSSVLCRPALETCPLFDAAVEKRIFPQCFPQLFMEAFGASWNTMNRITVLCWTSFIFYRNSFSTN